MNLNYHSLSVISLTTRYTSTSSIIMFVATEPSTTTTCSVIQWSPLCRHFEFGEILSATNNFDESIVIGHGGFGKVYKGKIDNGSTLAAIKRLDSMPIKGNPSFGLKSKCFPGCATVI
ncbi:putative non-specific serine/threonine protein kinase [Helianthus annuus]|uniref:Non-specific serine/threonine protein kinase n=1 Tax=Helianthus annuus TaxID=4232 RepID=A0A9K3I285_HELAN|nr:putative non-specific serine/threonine protein kinase [Helianthus annuus]KAJ0524550.1 putative non-specific serine/threonine protein kinase [Helianthus annuus]